MGGESNLSTLSTMNETITSQSPLETQLLVPLPQLQLQHHYSVQRLPRHHPFALHAKREPREGATFDEH